MNEVAKLTHAIKVLTSVIDDGLTRIENAIIELKRANDETTETRDPGLLP